MASAGDVTATLFLSTNQEQAGVWLSSFTSVLTNEDGVTVCGCKRIRETGRVWVCVCPGCCFYLWQRWRTKLLFWQEVSFSAFILTSLNRRGLDRGELPVTTGSGWGRKTMSENVTGGNGCQNFPSNSRTPYCLIVKKQRSLVLLP